MKDKANFITDYDKKNLVNCLTNAVGDDLKESLRKARIYDKRSNSKKLLKWDLINRNFIDTFSGKELVAEYANRGAWYMVPIVDKKNGYIYSVMREDRFKELQKKQPKRRRAHYIDAFTQSFNFDLNESRQLSMFGNDNFEETEVCNIVDTILKSMNIDKNIILRHAIILFEEYNYELTSVRCCMLDSSLNIVEQENWSMHINHAESIITEQIDISMEQSNNALKPELSKKAKERLGQKDNVQKKEKAREYKETI